MKDLIIDPTVNPTLTMLFLITINDNWDSFYEQGVYCPIFTFEFYGIHEKKIMNNHIQVLEDNDWIYDCVGNWGSLLLLAAKPHQKSYIIIYVFIWRLCVSYRPLNSATRSSKLPISYYIDIIVNFGDSCDHINLITLNNLSRYHQIRIH